jgi:hypothetical protein
MASERAAQSIMKLFILEGAIKTQFRVYAATAAQLKYPPVLKLDNEFASLSVAV